MSPDPPRCATCRHWRRSETVPEQGGCRRFSGQRGYLTRISPTTAATFGCVLHEPVAAQEKS